MATGSLLRTCVVQFAVLLALQGCSQTTANPVPFNASAGHAGSGTPSARAGSAGVLATNGGTGDFGNGDAPTNESLGGSAGAAAAGAGSAKGLTLYYIRHAEVVANTLAPEQITLENSETLTELGLRQIEALTKYLQNVGVKPDAILVSPTKRTQKTIEPYLVATHARGEIWMDLTECCLVSPTGVPLPTAPEYVLYSKASLEAQNLGFRDPAENRFWKTDTFEQGLFMVMTAKTEFLAQYAQSGKTIFIVGHAVAGQLLIGLLRGVDVTNGAPTTGPNAVHLLNTGIMKLSQDPSTGLFKLVAKNINNPATE